MKISATIKKNLQQNDIAVETDGNQKEINIPAKRNGQGFLVNGGELLFLSLATCVSNNIYHAAFLRNINIKSMEVNVSGDFGTEDETVSDISCKVEIQSDTPKSEIIELINHVDKVSSINNTLRKGVTVSLQVE
jgi:uncharacterized OsmC-like protein